MRASLVFALALRGARSSATTRRTVAADASQSLDSPAATWSVSNGTLRVAASVPGDLITDLEAGGVIGDPLFELSFRGNATSPSAVGGVPWDATNFTYSAAFTLAADVAASPTVSLVFEGVKMVADVALNGVALGYTADQFLRYTFDVTAAVLRTSANTLTVTFPTGADARNVERRWMACSGGWCVSTARHRVSAHYSDPSLSPANVPPLAIGTGRPTRRRSRSM